MPKFTKGHTLSRGKRKPGGGRKKTPSTLIKEALVRNDQRLPKLFNKLYELAMKGDREATINLLDRSLGKVRTRTELEVTRGIDSVSAEDVLKFRRMIDAENKRLALMSPGEKLEDSYARQYGDKDHWPEWALEAVKEDAIEGEFKDVTEDSVTQ